MPYSFMKNVVTCVTCCEMEQFFTECLNLAWLLVGYSLVTRSLLFHAAFYEVSN